MPTLAELLAEHHSAVQNHHVVLVAEMNAHRYGSAAVMAANDRIGAANKALRDELVARGWMPSRAERHGSCYLIQEAERRIGGGET